jgi:hypothetical protein
MELQVTEITWKNIRDCNQKFPDWPPGVNTAKWYRTLAITCSCIAILWVSLVSFAVITLCVAFQRVSLVYFVIDSVRRSKSSG